MARRSSSCASTSRAESCCRAARDAVIARSRPRILRTEKAASTSPSPIVIAIVIVIRLELREDGIDAHLAVAQLRFVDAANLVGDPEHRHAAREDFVAEEAIAG